MWIFSSYCIFLGHLPSRMLVLMMHHLQRILLQKHPTNNYHSPTRIILFLELVNIYLKFIDFYVIPQCVAVDVC